MILMKIVNLVYKQNIAIHVPCGLHRDDDVALCCVAHAYALFFFNNNDNNLVFFRESIWCVVAVLLTIWAT